MNSTDQEYFHLCREFYLTVLFSITFFTFSNVSLSVFLSPGWLPSFYHSLQYDTLLNTALLICHRSQFLYSSFRFFSGLATSTLSSHIPHSSFTCSFVKAHLSQNMSWFAIYFYFFLFEASLISLKRSYLCSSDPSRISFLMFCSLMLFISFSLCWISAVCWTCWLCLIHTVNMYLEI